MTSGYGVETRTYGNYASVGAVVTRQTNGQAFDEARGGYVRAERLQIRTSDAVSLKQGDQFRLNSSDAQLWAVIERSSGGPGSALYMCERDVPTLATGGDRQAGV